MARLRVRLIRRDPRNEYRYLRPSTRTGETVTVPVLRLVTTVLVGRDPPAGQSDDRPDAEALIDTGAPVTLIGHEVWQDYNDRGLVEWLERPGTDDESAAAPTVSLLGRSLTYDLGRVWISVLDADDRTRRLPAVPLFAQLLHNHGTKNKLPFPIVLGLHRGVLDGRRLVRDPVMGADYNPARRHDNDADAGPSFGQEWRLGLW